MKKLIVLFAFALPISSMAALSPDALQLRNSFKTEAKAPSARQVLQLVIESRYWTCTAHGAATQGPWETLTVHPNYFRFGTDGTKVVNTTRPSEEFQVINEGLAGNRSTRHPTMPDQWYTDAYHLIRFVSDTSFVAEVLFVKPAGTSIYPGSAVLQNLDHLAVRAYLECTAQ